MKAILTVAIFVAVFAGLPYLAGFAQTPDPVSEDSPATAPQDQAADETTPPADQATPPAGETTPLPDQATEDQGADPLQRDADNPPADAPPADATQPPRAAPPSQPAQPQDIPEPPPAIEPPDASELSPEVAPPGPTQLPPAGPGAPSTDQDAPPGGATDLGFQFDTQGDRMIVNRVIEGSIADRAGLRANDRIVMIDGQQFASRAELNAYLQRQPLGEIPLVVQRDGQRQTLYLQMDSRPGLRPGDDSRPYLPAGPVEAGLGVGLQSDRFGNVWITSIYAESPAHQVGLWEGDRLVSVNGQHYCGAASASQAIRNMRPGQMLAVRVERNGRFETFNPTLDRREVALAGPLLRQPDTMIAGRDAQRRTVLRPPINGGTLQEMQSQIDTLQQRVDSLQQEVTDLRSKLNAAGQPGGEQGSTDTTERL